MTQVTMPDLAAAVRALEARKALLSGAAAALAAPDGLAAELFEAALADPGARRWPFDLAWVHPAVRGAAAPVPADHPVTAPPPDGADRLRVPGRVRLGRARGGRTRRHGAGAAAGNGPPDPLTARELQVAELAAAGLSNKQIGARLYMSHRTVSAHLYRVFPKLGVSSRAALRDALASC